MSNLRKIRSALGCGTRDLAEALDITHARASAYVNGSRAERLTSGELEKLKMFIETRISSAIQAAVIADSIAANDTQKGTFTNKGYKDCAHRLQYQAKPSIYVIKQFDRAKVGFTNRPETRLKEYKLHQFDADYALLREGGRGDEFLLHQILQPFHIGGEWYTYNAEVQKVLDEFETLK